jgi:ATP phosphoribosyltransferase regulatory subunit
VNDPSPARERPAQAVEQAQRVDVEGRSEGVPTVASVRPRVVGTAENALPPGMRDVLPPKAVRQSRVGSRLMRSFELFGFGRVWLPMFEYAHVLERARSEVGATLRFVEPESGEVVALRSDMTPQVARLVSTRYRTAPRPVRLCYQGSVLRRRRERARTASQVIQAGAELIGKSGLGGDFEALQVVSAALRRTGLQKFVLDIGHAGIAAALLDGAPGAARAGLVDALSAKDRVVLEQRAREAGLSRDLHRALCAVTELHGGVDRGAESFWARADAALGATPAAASVRELRALAERVAEASLAPEIVVDLGEVRGFDYYTGPMFQVLALGPGEPIASGGRYDTLYERFGLPGTPAAGFAVDVHNLCWALETAAVADPSYPRLVADARVSPELLEQLRELGVVCCTTSDDVTGYAHAYQFEFTLHREGAGVIVRALGAGASIEAANAEAAAPRLGEFIKSVFQARA